MRKNKAFTLAEVLVTLGIIGVVSAMTIPTLMNSYQRQTYVAQLHKVYTEMSQAFVQYQSDNNGDNLFEAGMRSQAAANAFVPRYLKVVETCDESLTPCFIPTTDYKKMNGTALTNASYTALTSYVLASGSSVRLSYTVDGQKIANLMVDVNGKKGPNVLGRDLFTMALYRDGTLDENAAAAPVSREARDTLYTSDCTGNGATAVWGCFGKILNDGWQMTY